jgi:hypothetical protein
MFVDEDEDFEIINGKPVLRDQHRIRVRLADAQRSRDRASLTDGRGAPHMVGHRPGFIMSRDARQQDAREEAYRAYERDLSLAYLARAYKDQGDDPVTGFGSSGPRGSASGEPAGAYPYRPELVGTPCTQDDFAGTLQRRGDFLVCVVNKDDDKSDPELAQSDRRTVANIQKAHAQKMEALYQSLDQELASRWRNPA